MSGSCPSCGFKWQSEALEQSAARCPRCGAGDTASMAPVYASMLGLVALLLLAVGAIAWSMPAGPWLVGAGAVGLLACAVIVWRSVARDGTGSS